MIMRRFSIAMLGIAIPARLAAAEAVPATPLPDASFRVPALPPPVDLVQGKPRLFVLTDIGNEPDDQMSMVRLMLYSNEIDIEGLVAGTSIWQRSASHPETIRAIVNDYGVVKPNLEKHAQGWPALQQLLSAVASGQPGYGMAAVGPGKSTPGSEALIKAVDRSDERPLWVSIWGGANTLAQALLDVQSTRTSAELAAFVAKLRIYAISDQDDAGPWIRRNFPGISYIVQPSSIDADDYAAATWTGISGDVFYRNSEGADTALVTNEWLQSHIRAKGPLGRHYLKFAFIMEGDTPSFLNLIGNGLEAYRSPSWGGWGGRYIYRKPAGEVHAIWTQGGDSSARIDSRDMVVGVDKRIHVSNQATIWRWRQAYQNDFAARMDWTIKPFAEANHRPQVTIDGKSGSEPLFVTVEAGRSIVMDASASRDPDQQKLQFRWFVYPEAGYSAGISMADLEIRDDKTAKATLNATSACRAQWLPRHQSCTSGIVHVILAVTDDGSPALTSYRRIVVTVVDPNKVKP